MSHAHLSMVTHGYVSSVCFCTHEACLHLQKNLYGSDYKSSSQGLEGNPKSQEALGTTTHASHPLAYLVSRGSSFFSWKWPISLRSKAIQLCGSGAPIVSVTLPGAGSPLPITV